MKFLDFLLEILCLSKKVCSENDSADKAKSIKWRRVSMRKGISSTGITPADRLAQTAFHSYFGKFFRSLELLEFVNVTSDKLFHKHFEEWQNEINKKILRLSSDSKITYEKITKLRNSKQKLKNKINYDDPKLAYIINEELRLGKIHSSIFWVINEMSLVYTVTQFEEFFKGCMKLIFKEQPLALKSKKMIEISKIVDTKTHNDVIQLAIKKKIDSVLDEGINEIEKYLIPLKIDLRKDNDWRKLKECFYRRNVLIHNDGFPSEEYMKKVGNRRANERLYVTNPYLKNSLRLFRKYSHIIADHLDKKFYPKKDFHSGKDRFSINV